MNIFLGTICIDTEITKTVAISDLHKLVKYSPLSFLTLGELSLLPLGISISRGTHFCRTAANKLFQIKSSKINTNLIKQRVKQISYVFFVCRFLLLPYVLGFHSCLLKPHWNCLSLDWLLFSKTKNKWK